MIWSNLTTDQRISAIRDIYEPGMNSTAISAHFKGASRNAIVGMYHRYPDRFTDKPLPTAAKYIEAKRKRHASKPLKQIARKPVETREPLPTRNRPSTVGRPLVAIYAGMCKWAVNDAEPGEVHLFCGAPTERVYCAGHSRLAYSAGTESERSAHRVKIPREERN